MLNRLKLISCYLIGCFILSACASLNQSAAQLEYFAVKGYGGNPKSDEQLVHVIGSGHNIFLCGFDGNNGTFAPFLKGPLYYKGFDLAVAPGEHKLCITYGFTDTYHTDPIQLPISGNAADRFIITYSLDSSKSVSVGLVKKAQFLKFTIFKNGLEQNNVVVPISTNFY